jgi:hypothetical protein
MKAQGHAGLLREQVDPPLSDFSKLGEGRGLFGSSECPPARMPPGDACDLGDDQPVPVCLWHVPFIEHVFDYFKSWRGGSRTSLGPGPDPSPSWRPTDAWVPALEPGYARGPVMGGPLRQRSCRRRPTGEFCEIFCLVSWAIGGSP